MIDGLIGGAFDFAVSSCQKIGILGTSLS